MANDWQPVRRVNKKKAYSAYVQDRNRRLWEARKQAKQIEGLDNGDQ